MDDFEQLLRLEVPAISAEKWAAELTASALAAAGRKTDPEPTEAQKESGRYRKGRVTWKGLPLVIETAKGQVRSGTSKSGKAWSIVLKDAYGYVGDTESKADGDPIDVFICDAHPESEIVFVVNQRKEDGRFDEAKTIIGVHSKADAERVYLRNYAPGWKGMGEVTPITLDHFKWWLENGDTSKEVKNGFFAAKENRKREKVAYADPFSGECTTIDKQAMELIAAAEGVPGANDPYAATDPVMKTEKRAADPASGEPLESPLNVTIDRPKGFKKTFQTKAGPKELEYPLDYGYFPGTVNPEDNEDADVFVGTGGSMHGRFMKGKPGPDGSMVPDERKWYAGLHPHEYEALKNWWETQHDAGLTWDWTDLGDRHKLLADAGVKTSPMERLRSLLAQLKHEADARGYHYFAVANDPAHPDAGAEVSGIQDNPNSVIRKHIQLHRDWAKQHGYQDVTWDADKIAKTAGDAEKRYLSRYKCPGCGGTNFFNGAPGTGTTWRGGGACTDCGHSCTIVGSKMKSIGDGPEIVSTPDQIERKKKRDAWDAKYGAAGYAPCLLFVKRADDNDTPFTIAVDLDGTLAAKEEPFDSKTIGEPRERTIHWVKKFHEAGARIIIFTVRDNNKLVEDWLKTHEIPYDFVNENPDQPPNSSGKVFADVYFDDRGVDATDPDATGPEVLRRIDAEDGEEEEKPTHLSGILRITRTTCMLVPGEGLLEALHGSSA
jgi:inorganic pyrophosphatase